MSFDKVAEYLPVIAVGQKLTDFLISTQNFLRKLF